MSAPISIVIPTLNAGHSLPGTLQALMEGLHSGLIRELIVTDGGSEDPTLEMADEGGAMIVTGPASRGGQLQRGCAKASGDWLLILPTITTLQSLRGFEHVDALMAALGTAADHREAAS